MTNNEVSADEQQALREAGLRPGDPEWEALGICDHITKPRIEAAITGRDAGRRADQGRLQVHRRVPDGRRLRGERRVLHPHLREPRSPSATTGPSSGSPRCCGCEPGREGRRIDTVPDDGWDVADTYGVLFDLDQADDFLEAVDEGRDGSASPSSSPTTTAGSSPSPAELPDGVEPVRLYESYLRTSDHEPGVSRAVHAEGLPGRRRRRRPHQPGKARATTGTRTDDRTPFSLSATTGAGKTVMAAAVIEALFHGNDDSTSRPTPARSCCGSPTTRA